LAGESNLERRIAVREALGEVAELPQMQRAAIFLTAVDGQTHDEVADALGISHGALRGLLYRARATLRGAAAALTPSPLLAWASNGTGAAAPSAERLAELAAGGGAGFAGVLLKGAIVAVTAGALATGAGVVADHERESTGRPHRAPRAALPTAPAATHEHPGAGGAASALALVELRSTRPRHGGRARHGEQHGDDGSSDGVMHSGRKHPSPRSDDGDDGRGSRTSGNEEKAGRTDDRGGSAAAPGSTDGSSPGGSAGREQSPSGDRQSGSDGSSQSTGSDAGQVAAAEVVQAAVPEAEQASDGQTSGGQTSGGQTQGGGSDDGTGGSSGGQSSHPDG
ncbi:MAG TPA: sigma-70 family RNA polymerase sigma factor, partial [Solirubrobacteraceae bacterium]|nr:sigma-70 family RNA polymerase sigma factor [Solirubrobacteraceae bacterium]